MKTGMKAPITQNRGKAPELQNDVNEERLDGYVAFAKAYNQKLEVLDEDFKGITPMGSNVLVRCLTSPVPKQVELTNPEDSARRVIRTLHPAPLLPVGVVVATTPGSALNVGDIVQVEPQMVISPNTIAVPAGYPVPFFDKSDEDQYGYILVSEHRIQAKLKTLPDLYAEFSETTPA